MSMLKTGVDFHERHERFAEQLYLDPDGLPDRYVFVVTNRCNLRCPFCFQNRRQSPNAMTVKDWIRLVDQVPDYARITLTGGEPLLLKRIEDLLSRVAARFDCNMITNGLLMSERTVDFLLGMERFRVLALSIDNIGNTLRGVDPGAWERLRSVVSYFNRRRAETGSTCALDIKTLILDENAGDLLAIRRYCVEELKCDSQSFQFLKGSPIQHADVSYSMEDAEKTSSASAYEKFDVIREQMALIREYNQAVGAKAFLHPKIISLNDAGDKIEGIDIMNEMALRREHYRDCRFPWASVHVNFDGNLFPCLAVPWGNVREQSLADIMKSPAAMAFKNRIAEAGLVQGCNRCGWLRLRTDTGR